MKTTGYIAVQTISSAAGATHRKRYIHLTVMGIVIEQ